MKNIGPMKITSLGIQHVLAMYAGAVIVPLIVGGALGLTAEQLTYLVSIDIMMCGVATLLQLYRNKFMGIGLPVMLGCTFTAVAPMIAIIASGLIVVLISKFFGKLVRFFPPVVTGSVVTIIGITLIPVAINNLAGGQGSADFGSLTNLALGFGTLLVIIVLYKFSTGFLRAISVLVGLIIGTVAAFLMGMVVTQNIADAAFFRVPTPFYFGMPTFEIAPIVTMTLVAIVSLVESTGTYFALADITGKKLKEEDLEKGYRAEGFASILGGLFNAFPYTTFSQNVGLLQMSGVKTKKVIYVAAGFLILFGLVPKIGAVTTVIPSAVIGGAMVAMFGMVISAGIKILSQVNLASQENMFIVAISVAIGLGVTVVPDLFAQLPGSITILTSNGIVAGSVTAIVLNIVFNMIGKKKEAEAIDPATAQRQAS